MPYIGTQPTTGVFTELDALTASATADYALTLGGAAYNPATVNNLLVSINGVIQAGSTMSLSGSTLTVGATLSSSDVIDFVRVFGSVGTVSTPTDGSVTTAKLGNGSVTAAKLAAGVQGVAGITTASTSGTAMSIDSSNRILTPARPAFSVRGSGSWVDVANGSEVTIVMASADVNIGSYYSTSTYKFTAPIAGAYWFSANVYLRNNGGSSSDSGTYGYSRIKKNGSVISGLESIHGYLNNGDADQTTSISGLVQLAVNDYITVNMQSTGGGTSSYHGSSTSFHGYLIG